VSVLTEPRWFHGSLGDLEAVAAGVAAPVLRKDFVVDGYQLWEARAAGAAAALLIVAALDDEALVALLRTAAEAGIDALVEVHDAAEAERAGHAFAAAATGRAAVVGVNARDLATLTVDPHRFRDVRDALPSGAVAVAESGVRGPESLDALRGLGAQAVLVGEHVATAPDPVAAVRGLVQAGAPGASAALRRSMP
jgi:indole-3-glycerol phosphate synthase